MAVHAVVHVYEMQSRRYEGQRLLRTSRWFWDDANHLFTHLHWHWGTCVCVLTVTSHEPKHVLIGGGAGLFQLEDGQYERTMARYDTWIRDESSNLILNLCDAVSMLWRLELYGNDGVCIALLGSRVKSCVAHGLVTLECSVRPVR